MARCAGNETKCRVSQHCLGVSTIFPRMASLRFHGFPRMAVLDYDLANGSMVSGDDENSDLLLLYRNLNK